jgi:hypothetical protein
LRQGLPQTPLEAQAQYRQIQTSSQSLSQVTSVSELRDVEPTEWAYEALRSLVERYGCIIGYPDRTFRGNRALTRWEFAAGLNACLNTMERLLQENVAVLQEDLDKLKRLSEEFASELAALGTRIDNLESRVAYLEDHQFSTTTKLFAQVIWSVGDTFGDRVGGNDDETQTSLGYRIRFNMETSFTGKDTLRTRLQMGNLVNNAPLTGTNMTRLNYDDNSNNQVQTPHLWYRTPLGESLTLRVGPAGIGYTDLVDTITPPTIPDDSLGIPSRFGEYDVVYRRGGGGAGLNWDITDNLEFSVGYVAGNNENPTEGNGLFNGTYHALAQLYWQGDSSGFGFAYSRSYYSADADNPNKVDLTSGIGSFLAAQPFGDSISTTGNFYTLQGYHRFTPNFQVHAWGGYVDVVANGSGFSNISNSVGNRISTFVSEGNAASIWYGLIGFTFPDVGGEGWLPGLVFGLPPRVANSSVRSPDIIGRGEDTSYHIEAFYRVQINDYLALTPGFWVILNPENDSRNSTQWVGHLRTSFNF